MARNKLIALRGAEPGSGQHTISRALAEQWVREGEAVAVLETQPAQSSWPKRMTTINAEWLERFAPLAPDMVRNSLNPVDSGPSYGYVANSIDPEKLKSCFRLVRSAFDWTLVLLPAEFNDATLAALDSAMLLLWIAKPAAPSFGLVQAGMNQLASQHFPNAFSQIILNRAPTRFANKSLPPHLVANVIAKIADDSNCGADFRAGVARLAESVAGRAAVLDLPSGSPTTTTVEKKMVEEIKTQVQPRLLRALEEKKRDGVSEAAVARQTIEACLAADASLPASRQERIEIYTRVMDDVLGLGPVEPLLKDPSISEVMINGQNCVYIERRGKLEPTEITFSSDAQLRTLIERIVAPLGRRVDESMPLCDARLADGSRVNIVLPPLSLDGPSVTIRKFMARALSLDDLAGLGSLNRAMADFLQDCVVGRRNIVVSGGTGSGKTTLLNALSSVIPEDERIVTIEDAAELRLQKPHVVRLESRPPNAEGEGAIPIRRLVINALRMRPDRIVVGECRGGEALDMLQAMNTGHDGSLTTVHANSPRDALGRLETLVLMAGMDLPVRVVREQIRSAVHVIVQQARLSDGSRKIISITEITGMEGEVLLSQELYRYNGRDFESTGYIPHFNRRRAGAAPS